MRRAIIVITILTLATLVLWVVRSLASPDLSKCTRIEVRCPLNVMLYFFHGRDDLFNTEEKEYVQSCDTWVVDDPNRIKSFAEAVGHVTCFDEIPGLSSEGLKIACYRGILRIASLETVLAAGPNWDPIRYPQAVRIASILVPPGIQKLCPRFDCVRRIESIPIRRIEAPAYRNPN